MSFSKVSLFVLSFFVTTLVAFHIEHRAICTRKQVCNGNLMCADVCERGTVQVDPWIISSLNYQKQLQYNDLFVYFEMPSTHNSAVTEADGFGIEKYFVSSLYGGKDYNQGDDLGEGVCQYLSLTDQMNLGVRHIEIDIWWGPKDKEIAVCHSPIPLFPVGNISRTAEERNISLTFDPKKFSCLGTKRSLTDVLTEVYSWMMLPQNLNEIIMVYFDTKFYLSPDQVTESNNLILSIFGDMVFKASEGNPVTWKVSELLSKNKRIMFENQKECWSKPASGDQLVFYPALWDAHQFSADSLQEFPSCAIAGDNSWYGNTWVRALDGSVTEAATRCGVPIVSGNYLNPDDLKFNVWSWDQQEPSSADGCVAMLPTGRWATLPCETKLPFACVSSSSLEKGDFKNWSVNLNTLGSFKDASCDSGYIFSAPHNGYANALLNVASLSQTIWLNAPNPKH